MHSIAVQKAPTAQKNRTLVCACHLKVALKENCHKLHLNAMYLSLSFGECVPRMLETTPDCLPGCWCYFLEPEPKFVAKPICCVPGASLLGQSSRATPSRCLCTDFISLKGQRKIQLVVTSLRNLAPLWPIITRGYQTISQLRLMMIHCRLIRALNFRDSERLKICTSFGTANWGFISVGFSDADEQSTPLSQVAWFIRKCFGAKI